MKLIFLSLLPAASAYKWYTNSGWSKPAEFNSAACESSNTVNYFCVRQKHKSVTGTRR